MCEEGQGGCGMWLEMGFGTMGDCISEKLGGKLQLCDGACVSLPACLALSSGQETPTVSAVSLTANEFPGRGGWCMYVSMCVCVCVSVWLQMKALRDYPGKSYT